MTNFYHILVLAEAYPTQGQPAALRYIHSRNLAYRENGHDVEVINFSASSDYAIDGITVFGADSGAGIDASNYDIVLLHAPNLKHHIKWWSRHKSEIKALILFAHGHEFLDADKVYPAEFDFVQRPVIRGLVRKIYDRVKLAYWARLPGDLRQQMDARSGLPFRECLSGSSGSTFCRRTEQHRPAV